MQRSTEFAVGDRRYQTTQYPATKGLKLLTRLSKIVGKPLGMFASRLDEKATPDLIGNAIEAMLAQVDEEIVVKLVDDILSSTQIIENSTYRPINFNIDFAGSYGHLFKVIKEILSFQYSDFFGELADASAILRQDSTKPSTKIKAK